MGKRDFEDDGRTIADMSGITRPSLFGRIPKSREKKAPPPPEGEETPRPVLPQFTAKESRALVLQSLGAALLIALLFIAAFAAFLLFCQFVWFR